MTRYLLVGARGLLGRELLDLLEGREVSAPTRAELDVADATAVADAVAGHDVVINAAGYTDVDRAEADEHSARLANAIGPGHLASACARSGARFVHVSTDYVFDGTAEQPYAEDAPTRPLSAYGRTKVEGEHLVSAGNPDAPILRTAWLYGEYKPGFASAMLRLDGEGEEVRVVDDQVGQPTWARDVAGRIVEVADRNIPGGIYHATNTGHATRFEFARELFRLAGLDPERIRPASSADFPRPAPRPAYSVLGQDAWQRAGLAPLRTWRDALADAVRTGAVRAG